jgi:putative colanic acid biosynthesis acetyltransferase WcaF
MPYQMTPDLKGGAEHLAGFPGYRWLRRLPPCVKRLLLACYWPFKAWVEDWQDYTAELVGHVPCHALRLWWICHICRLKAGRRSSIHRGCRFYRAHRITIGHHSVINYGVLLDGRRGLSIGDNVSISEGTAIFTLAHDVDHPGFVEKSGPVVVGDRVFVGAHARILPGVTLGEGAVVAAGAVVTRDVAPYTVVAGVPARYLRDRTRELDYVLNHRKRFG